MKEPQPISPSSNLGSLNGERGLPSVNDTWSSYKKSGQLFMVTSLIVFIFGGIFYIKYKKHASSNLIAPEKTGQKISSTVPKILFSDQAPPLPEQVKNSNSVKNALKQVSSEEKNTMSDSGDLNEKNLQLLAIYSSPLMVPNEADQVSKNHSTPLNQIKESIVLPYEDINYQSHKKNQPKDLSELMQSTSTSVRTAGYLGNRNFILAKGSFIDCALQTKLDSTVPGMTSCVVTRNIYSDNGKVLLIERGSTISGEYQSNVQQGKKRIFVLWSRLKTPNGIVIDLESPGADSLGASGLPGHVNDHFWQRFGGAIMLSLVDDIARASTSSKNNSTNFNFNSSGEAAQNMASEALKNTINIPPTLYKNQGEQIGIYIARDLNFSSVYDIKLQ